MPNLCLKAPERSNNGLQVIARTTNVATVPVIPVIPLRKQILDRYFSGETEREISTRMKMPIESVRLVLRGYHEISRRLLARSSDRTLRAQEPEVAAEVWQDLSKRRAA
jgi:hypothetical protein